MTDREAQHATEAHGTSDSTEATRGTLLRTLTGRLADVMPGVREDLEALVRIPSVSAPSFDQRHVEASAQAVARLLRGEGFSDVEVLRAPKADGGYGAPGVVGRRPGPEGAPTVLLYAHHDVQPPGQDGDWVSPPFEPTERDGRLFGRGAADDKAGVMAHVAALRLLGEELPVGVTVFVEGEEEAGSPTFAAFLEQERERLAADVIVVADSTNWQVGVPALTTSLRGLVDCVVEVATLDHAVHSGMYGGPVVDAMRAMVALLAGLHDEKGDVAVRGLTTAAAADPGMTEELLRADAGVLDGVRLVGTGSLAERLWTKPSISVTGIDAPSVAKSSNTLWPSVRVKLSMRLAPGQVPVEAYEALRAHLESSPPFGARVTVTEGELGKPFAAPTHGQVYDAARWAFEAAWGVPPVEVGIGGSIPFIAELLETYPDAVVLVTGVEDPDSRAHGANESLHLGEFAKVCLAEALLLTLLGARVVR